MQKPLELPSPQSILRLRKELEDLNVAIATLEKYGRLTGQLKVTAGRRHKVSRRSGCVQAGAAAVVHANPR